MIRNTNHELAEKTCEYNALRSDYSVMESKNYAEKKEMERLESEIRDQSGLSHKYYQEMSRLKDIANSRDVDNSNMRAKIDSMEAEVQSNNNRIQQLYEVKEQKEQNIASLSQ